MKFDSETAETVKVSGRDTVSSSHDMAVSCKFCGSAKIYHFGYTVKGRQRYLCTDCKRTFLNNQAPDRMRFPSEAIAFALNQFYESASLCNIQRQLQLTYRVVLHHSTIYRWIIRYSLKAVKLLSAVPVKAGSRWIADETLLKLKDRGGSIAWFWDVMDERTKFLLASHLVEGPSARDARTLMKQAARRAGRIPRAVIADKLSSYLGRTELTFDADNGHISSNGFQVWPNVESIDRFHEALKDRTRVIRSYMRRKTARIIMNGWLAHYNFFRPNAALGWKTPAEAAGARILFKNWSDVVNSE